MPAVTPMNMHMRASGERGFTLIELLVAVLLVSLLAAVVLPMANRFADSGEEEARLTEFHDVTTGVILLMTHNQLFSIPNPVTGKTPPCTVGTQILSEFPDTDSDDGQGVGNDGGKEVDVFGNPYTFTGPQPARTSRGMCSMTTTPLAVMAKRPCSTTCIRSTQRTATPSTATERCISIWRMAPSRPARARLAKQAEACSA